MQVSMNVKHGQAEKFLADVLKSTTGLTIDEVKQYTPENKLYTESTDHSYVYSVPETEDDAGFDVVFEDAGSVVRVLIDSPTQLYVQAEGARCSLTASFTMYIWCELRTYYSDMGDEAFEILSYKTRTPEVSMFKSHITPPAKVLHDVYAEYLLLNFLSDVWWWTGINRPDNRGGLNDFIQKTPVDFEEVLGVEKPNRFNDGLEALQWLQALPKETKETIQKYRTPSKLQWAKNDLTELRLCALLYGYYSERIHHLKGTNKTKVENIVWNEKLSDEQARLQLIQNCAGKDCLDLKAWV